jgi:type III secretion protein L
MKFFSYLYPGSLHRTSGKKVIPSKEFTTLLEAKEALEKAVQEAEQYKKDNEAECQKLKEKAESEGFQKGLEEFNVHLRSLDEEAKKIYLDAQKAILSLALQAAKKIVNKELEVDPNSIVDIVMGIMAPIKQNKKVTIFVNKADLQALDQNKPRMKEMFDQIQVLSVVERADVSPGGCMIETESGIINATAENQWKAMELAFDSYKQQLSQNT